MRKLLVKTETTAQARPVAGRRMVVLNTGIIVFNALFYGTALFYTKTLAWGVIFMLGMAIYNLLQIGQLRGRPKIAAKLWLMPAILSLTTYPIPLTGPAQPAGFAILAPVQSILAAGGSLVLFIAFMLARQDETAARKPRPRPLVIELRILLQTCFFILYLVVTAHSWLTGSKLELLFWGAVNVLTAAVLPFLFGRALCGWLCPNAALQDAVYKNLAFKRPLAQFAPWILEQSKAGSQQQAVKSRKEAPYLPVTLLLAWFPMFFLETVFDLTGVFWYPLAFMSGLFILSLLMPWRRMCTCFCWFSAYRCLASHNSLFRLHIDRSKCRQCKVCLAEKECPFAIDIKNLEDEMPATCCLCMNCMEACVSPGTIRFGLPPVT